jgi:type VI secretion system ImpA/VasJ family protein
MTATEIETRAATWTLPISDENPCGENARYEPAYEELLNEIGKLEAVDAGEPDWNGVFTKAAGLLEKKTKDMTVVGSLAVALLKKERFKGLASGLLAYLWLVQSFWEKLFPSWQRMRGRSNAYSWMTAQLQATLQTLEPKPAEHEDLLVCKQHFEALDAYLREKFAELHPRVADLKRLLDYFIEQTKAVQAAAPAQAAPPAGGGDGAQADGVVAEAAEWGADATPQDASAPVALEGTGPGLPKKIENERQAEQVVQLAMGALKMASEFFTNRMPHLEGEKQKIEERIRKATAVIELGKSAESSLAPGGGGEVKPEE